MRTLFLPGIVLAASLSILAQTTNSSTPAEGPKVPPPCAVSGRVVGAATGNPLRSAHVALESENYDKKFDVLAATTADDGRFVLKNVPAGRYRFLAVKPGYVKQYYEGGDDGGTILALQPGQELKDVFFRMTMSAVITGRVNDEEGEPLVNISVVVLRWPSKEELEDEDASGQEKRQPIPAGFGETDDRGEYRIFGLKPGEYLVKASESGDMRREHDDTDFIRQELGSEHAPVYYPGVVQVSQAQPVLLRSGDEVQADFSMPRTATVEIAGRVLGLDGKPAANTQVSIDDREAVYGFEGTVFTDEDGTFRLRGVPPGSYMLMAYIFSEKRRYTARQKIEVGGSTLQGITLAVGRGLTIHGHVTLEGSNGGLQLNRCRVLLESVDKQDFMNSGGNIKEDSTFEFLDVADGSYRLFFARPDGAWYVKSARIGSDDVLNSGLQVENGHPTGALEVVLSHGSAQVEGLVTDHDEPVIGASVHIAPDPETPYNRTHHDPASTDQTGHFVLSHVPPGRYRVVAKVPATDGTRATSEPEVVTLSENEHKSVQLSIEKGQNQ